LSRAITIDTIRDAAKTVYGAAIRTPLVPIGVITPGGPEIFDAIERALGLDSDALLTSRAVFANYGNASSAGIFFVLAALESAPTMSRALVIAFGPGLSIELALLRFDP